MSCDGCNRAFETFKLTRKDNCHHMLCNFCYAQKLCVACANNKHNLDQLDSTDIHNENDCSKVYVGNIPYMTTAEQLRLLFALCGPIEKTEVFPYVDFRGEEKSYGFVTFSNPTDAKMAENTFAKKTYKQHVLRVVNDKNGSYGIFVKNLPPNLTVQLLTNFFEAYGPVKSAEFVKPNTDACFVNFAEDTARRQVVNSKVTLPFGGIASQLSIQLKEPNKTMNYLPIQPGAQFELFVANIPHGTSKDDLKTMFELCGPVISTYIVFKVLGKPGFGFVNFATLNGRNEAMKFNDVTPDRWPCTISLTDEKREKTVAPKPMPVQKPHADRRFGVRVIGFNSTMTENELHEHFKDAGNIVHIAMKVNSAGLPYAFINYDTEEAMEKALAWQRCLIGYPSQTLKIDRTLTKEGPPQRVSHASSNSINSLNLGNSSEQLSRSVSQMSLGGRASIMVDNVPTHMTMLDLGAIFSSCGTITSLEILEGTSSNVAKIMFNDPAAAAKARQINLPSGTNGSPMSVH